MTEAWDLLFAALRRDQEKLVERCRETMLAKLPAYRALPQEAIDNGVRLDLEHVLRLAYTGRTEVSEAELTELAAIGEQRAHQGLPVIDYLRAWRFGIDIVVGYAQELGRRLGVEDAQVLEFIRSSLAWADAAMVVTADAHRKAEFALAHAEQGQRAALARGILFGEVAAGELRIHAEALGLDPGGEYVALRARAADGVSARKFEQALGFGDPGQRSGGLCALVDGDIAGFLPGPPPGDIDGVVGYGPPRPLDQLRESYRLATRALMTALACGFQGVYDIASLGVRAAVAMDADVGESLCRRYLERLTAGPTANEIVSTLRTYLSCGMHVEQTAKQLFVHQNTVRYRLARFEELTGVSLRDPEILVEVWWALQRSAMSL